MGVAHRAIGIDSQRAIAWATDDADGAQVDRVIGVGIVDGQVDVDGFAFIDCCRAVVIGDGCVVDVGDRGGGGTGEALRGLVAIGVADDDANLCADVGIAE